MIYNSAPNGYENICSPCTVHIVLFIIILIICKRAFFIILIGTLKKYTETTFYWMAFHWT